MTAEPRTVWRTDQATQMSVIIDAEDYFRHARAAMMQAKKRIMLIGWDFDARIQLVRDGHEDGEPKGVGEFIYWLVQKSPELEVFLLRWDVGALKTLVRGTTPLTVLKWMRHPRMHTKLDGAHPTGGSHHQKIMVIDDCMAFCGGIDMTADRWDTRAHRDEEPWRREPSGKPYTPWHDAIAAVKGPIAAALGDLARRRWVRAGGAEIDAVTGKFECWPEKLTPQFRDIAVSIARTRPEMPGVAEIREIEALFIDQIKRARHSIYAESQYFASRRVAEAIAARLKQPDPPEIVIINPTTAQGWLEPVAMDTARARLMMTLGRLDHANRFRMYHPCTRSGEPIYVHAKIMIVDGTSLRIGSANMNNRSMGLDSECDLAIAGESEADRAAIRAIRDDLIAEHLGLDPAKVSAEIDRRGGSIIQTIEALRGAGRSLRPYEVCDLNEVEKWLADNEVLDPESPSELFEPMSGGGLLRGYLGRGASHAYMQGQGA